MNFICYAGASIVFSSVKIYEEWKNHPNNVIEQVCYDITYVYRLVGEIENLDDFGISSNKIIELMD
jgi:hypothetical protein